MPSAAMAWGEDGHRIVARIAEKQLSRKAQLVIRNLVGDESISDNRIPNFADHIRGSSFFRKKYPNNDKYHFIDIDVNDPGPIDFEKYCAEGLCAPAVIQKMLAKLIDPDAKQQDRREALFFVIHLVGDIHQPLHCANRKDRGGNLLRVIVPDDSRHVTNLHHVWDTNLVLQAMGGMDVLDFADRLFLQSSAQDRKEFQKGDLKQWILQSNQTAKDAAYKGIPVQAAGADPLELSQEYLDANAEVVKTQLLRGGVRLAKLLNDTLG
jgi:hypothetical protein